MARVSYFSDESLSSFGALSSRHHGCGFKVSCTLFMYTSTLKPLPAYLLSKAIADLFIGGVCLDCGFKLIRSLVT